MGSYAGTSLLCQGKHGVSGLLKSFHDAIDGNDNGGSAYFRTKTYAKTCHKSPYLSELDECENMHWSRHIKFFPLCRKDKKFMNVSPLDGINFKRICQSAFGRSAMGNGK